MSPCAFRAYHIMKRLNRARQLAPAALAAALLLAVGACGGEYPNSTFNHNTELNEAIDGIWDSLLFWGTVVFVIVEALLLYTVFKYRQRPGAKTQVSHGNTALEITWTVVPIFILVVIAIPTVRVIFSTQKPAPSDAVEVQVIGHQWWWEFKYPQYGFSTANEMYIPTGRAVSLTLETKDVLHSFWVPQMGGKRDLISNRVNRLWFTPKDEVGTQVWNGFCTEYCGPSHANMKFRLYTVSPDEFAAWTQGQAATAAWTPAKADSAAAAAAAVTASVGAAPGATVQTAAGTLATDGTAPQAGWYFPAEKVPASSRPQTPVPSALQFDEALLAAGDPAKGLQVFSRTCIGCHAINGVPGAVSPIGPNLTHLATRHTIGAGLFPNDAAHLARWIKNAPAMKPGVQMNAWGAGQYDAYGKRTVTMGGLSDAEIADLVAYLQALK
jgi:cytochrome c oxidase subunit II